MFRFIRVDIVISSVITGIVMLINYISAIALSDIFIGIPSIGGEGNGKLGFGIWILYDLKEIRFDYFSLIIDFLLVLLVVLVVHLLIKAMKH